LYIRVWWTSLLLLVTPGADIPHVRLAMRYAQVRLSISSSLRTNDALFGCTSWNGYAYVPSKWVVQSPGVTNNNKLVHHTLMYNTYNHLLFILL